MTFIGQFYVCFGEQLSSPSWWGWKEFWFARLGKPAAKLPDSGIASRTDILCSIIHTLVAIPERYCCTVQSSVFSYVTAVLLPYTPYRSNLVEFRML